MFPVVSKFKLGEPNKVNGENVKMEKHHIVNYERF
jgi:hypothetical protein